MNPRSIVFCLLLLRATSGLAQPLPPGAPLFGKTMAEWSVDWVDWVYAPCTNENPVLDPDGRWAGVGQPATPVFLLAGIYQYSATVERTITVPENRYLFFPLLNGWIDNVGTIPPWSVEQLRDYLSAYIAIIERLDATLDGSAIADLFAYRATSPVFSLDLTNTCNLVSFLFGIPFSGLDDPIVADGYYLMLQPLTLGEHLLVFGGTVGPPNGFTISSTAHLNVVEVPLTQWLEDLISVIAGAALPDQQKQTYLARLGLAQKSFDGGSVHAGISHLRAFERTVRSQADANSTFTSDVLAYAERTIERASRELTKGGHAPGI